jgi:CheY-like chemotaxis protein
MPLILVIDDDQSVRTAVHGLLEHRGVDVLVADSGASGIRHLQTSAIDVAIVDVLMPDMDGLEVIRTLSRRTPRVPVIAMSGFLTHDLHGAAPDFLRMAGRLGAAFCLRKPFRPGELVAAIEACLGMPLGEPGHDAAAMSTKARSGREPGMALRVVGWAAGLRALGA